MLAEHGHHVGETTALKCRTELGWTRRGSAYCQMIREVNKVKQLEWARKNKGDDFSNAIFSDETTVQTETHRRFCCTKSARSETQVQTQTKAPDKGACAGHHQQERQIRHLHLRRMHGCSCLCWHTSEDTSAHD